MREYFFLIQVRTVITVERLTVIDPLFLSAKYSSMSSQVVASKERWSGDLLPETFARVWPEYDFSPFAKFVRDAER